MLRRPLRLLWDPSPPGGVVLSSFRSRDPEESGGPGGRGVCEGQEEEEEEEEDEVRCRWWEVGGIYFRDSTFPCLCPCISSPLTQLVPFLLLVSAFSRVAGSPGVSGSLWQCDSRPARRNLPC